MGIRIHTPTEGLKEKKLNDLSAMIQAIAPMVGTIGTEPLIGILAEMANTMDMPVLQRQLMQSVDNQSAGNMAAQMEAEKAQVEIMKQSADAQKSMANAEKAAAEADKIRYETLVHSFNPDSVDL
jgi:hypothetical protein